MVLVASAVVPDENVGIVLEAARLLGVQPGIGHRLVDVLPPHALTRAGAVNDSMKPVSQR
jgi:hypothetical protein